jgi:hypothetical protein
VRSFLILHGLDGSGPDHWQSWLAERLAQAGETVRYPDLPDASAPDADAWAEALHAELAGLAGERIVLCHSLACLLWAREAPRIAAAGAVNRVLLVAPPCPATPLPGVSGFFPVVLDAPAAGAASRESRVAGSDADPYCPAGAQRSFARPLCLPFDLLPGAGHVNPEAGYGSWPAVEAWCYGAKNGVDT